MNHRILSSAEHPKTDIPMTLVSSRVGLMLNISYSHDIFQQVDTFLKTF